MTVRILHGNSGEMLSTIAPKSVQCCVTSPPYYGLRDYGLPDVVFGGDATCDHQWGEPTRRHKGGQSGPGPGSQITGRAANVARDAAGYIKTGRFCLACGAWLGQLGLEPTPELYVEHLVQIFRLVREALADDGVLWLNLGDSYSTTGGSHAGRSDNQRGVGAKRAHLEGGADSGNRKPTSGLKNKDLIGIPWRAAFALQADGWWLRSDVVWSKPNPMPESVTDRPTKSHEYLFLLTKSERYFYDHDAIKEPLADGSMERLDQDVESQEGSDRAHAGGKVNGKMKAVVSSGNKERKYRGDHGGVEGSKSHQGFGVPWSSDGSHRPQYQRALEIAKEKGLTEKHFDAIRVCGFFGDSATKTRETQNGTANEEALALAREAKEALGGYYREFLQRPLRNKRSVWSIPEDEYEQFLEFQEWKQSQEMVTDVWTVTTKPFSGAHFATMPPALVEPCIKAGSRPGDVVLDPFGGAGTTGLVADRLGREAILVELNPKYQTMARDRITGDAPLFHSSEE